MRFWKNDILESCPGPIFQKPAKNVFLKMPPICPVLIFQKPAKNVFEKIQIWEQLLKSKSSLSAIHKIIWHIWQDRSRKVNNGEPDLRFFSRKLLTCHKPCRSKTLFFDLNPKGAKSVYPGFPDAAGAGRILKSRSRPLPTHPGIKYFRRGNPHCWCVQWLSQILQSCCSWFGEERVGFQAKLQ